MKLTRPPLIAAIVAAGAVAGFVYSRDTTPPPQHRTEPASSSAFAVTAATAEKRELPVVIKASGRAEARASVTVKSRLDGQVAAILFTEGGSVHKGQVLMRMDAAPAQAQLRQSTALLARDHAQLEKLQADRARNTELFQKGFISKSGLGQTEADFRSAEATLKADQASIDSAQLQLDFTNVLAPIDGVTGLALLSVGGAAKANDTPLVVINQVTPIRVAFALPEGDLERVKSSMGNEPVEVTATIPGTSAPLTGRLEFLDNAVDVGSGTIMAHALLANAAHELTPGQYVDLRLTLGHRPAAVAIPAAALENSVDGAFVFVVRADSTVEVRSVRADFVSDGFVAIGSGLAVGERVVIEGQSRLRDGTLVQLATAPSAPSPSR
jgi:multidrug efflux system membrane fusion protein